jgi:sugar transferase (PEP-CTERM/EpsH1 system associated)
MQTQLQQHPSDRPVRSSLQLSPARKKRLRVLHVVSCLGMGGTEHGVIKLINALGSEDFEHQICAVRGIDENFARRMDIETMVSNVGSAKQGFQFPLFRLARLMRRIRPHIVHTRNFGALEAIPAARVARVPVAIHSEHGYELEVLDGLPFRRRALCRAFYALTDEVFTVSDELRVYHSRQSWSPRERISVIHNGVNTDQFCPHPERAALVRSELGIPSGRVVIGTVGRIVPIKDHKTLLEAARILVREGRDIHVLIVGSGPELPKLQLQAATSPELAGRIMFLGASDRVPDLLNSMDLFVLPSISEGMSNTILEAMATGLPLIVTRAGGNPELVEDALVGRLFTPRDVQALAGILSHLVIDPVLRREYGQAARQRAVEHFSLTDMVRHYRDLYLDLAARRDVWKGH